MEITKQSKAAHQMGALISRLWPHLRPRRRRQFSYLLILMIAASLAEVFSIAALLPFLTVLSDPGRILQHSMVRPISTYFDLTTPDALILPMTVIFCGAVIFAGLLRLLLLWAGLRLCNGVGADLSNDIYRKTLYQPYSVHLTRNSSDVISAILFKVNGVVAGVITPLTTLVSSLVIAGAILVALLMLEPTIALLTFVSFGISYTAIIKITRSRVRRNGIMIAQGANRRTRMLQEGLGGIRDILLGRVQAVYCDQYRLADAQFRRATADNAFVMGSPRYLMEALGVVLIALIAFIFATRSGQTESPMPVLGALALGAQRMLPSLQQIYAAWTSIRGELASLQETLDYLDQSLPSYALEASSEPISFIRSIRLAQLSFRYNQTSALVLKKLNLDIERGERIGFIGATGSGKSTLLDIITGLLVPMKGAVEVDGVAIDDSNRRSWQLHIAYVSQSTYLSDASIAENIAFGLPLAQIDQRRIEIVARQALLCDVVEKLPEKFSTLVGERGVRLSGGQRQRIGIARALYARADVIAFDEATSALDSETESAVMEAINGLGSDITILMIAHRLTTLRSCTKIVELDNGSIKRQGSYAEIVTRMM